MISHPQPAEVFEELGDKVLNCFVEAVQATRSDLSEYRTLRPGWVADTSKSNLAQWIHGRLWANLVAKLDGLPHVSIVDKDPRHEIYVGVKYRFRVKRHDDDGRISTYRTMEALDFYAQDPEPLDGLEEVRLAVGYRWNDISRTIGATVISLWHDLTQKPLWCESIEDREGGTGTVGVEPLTGPTVPGPIAPSIGINSPREISN